MRWSDFFHQGRNELARYRRFSKGEPCPAQCASSDLVERSLNAAIIATASFGVMASALTT
jgi:hypothetical protein